VGCTREDLGEFLFFGTALPGITDAARGDLTHPVGMRSVSRIDAYGDAEAERYGTEVCDGDRVPVEALEDAVAEQMAEIFGDTALVGEALAVSRADAAGASEEAARRLASIQQQLSVLAGLWIVTSPRSSGGSCRPRIARSVSTA
jgi:hypothetical protein